MKTYETQPGPTDWLVAGGIVGLLLMTLAESGAVFFIAGALLSVGSMLTVMFILPKVWDQ